MTEKKLKVVFAPGAFDHFEGTQEELDALIKEIQEGFEDGTFFEKAKSVDFEDGTWSEEEIERVTQAFDKYHDGEDKTLH